MNFQNKQTVIQFPYNIGNIAVKNVSSLKDLGVVIDTKLNFKEHIDYISAKAVRVIGFIRKFTFNFKNCSVILYLYKTLALPILMYASPIWSPYLSCDQYRLETVQHKFLRYLSQKNGQFMDPLSHDYTDIMTSFKVPTLKSLREMRDIMFAYKLINDKIDCEYLCNIFKPRRLSHNLRNPRTFEEVTYSSNYTLYSTMPRLLRAWHELPRSITSLTKMHDFKMHVMLKTIKYT